LNKALGGTGLGSAITQHIFLDNSSTSTRDWQYLHHRFSARIFREKALNDFKAVTKINRMKNKAVEKVFALVASILTFCPLRFAVLFIGLP
jgi:aminopeptidase C